MQESDLTTADLDKILEALDSMSPQELKCTAEILVESLKKTILALGRWQSHERP